MAIPLIIPIIVGGAVALGIAGCSEKSSKKKESKVVEKTTSTKIPTIEHPDVRKPYRATPIIPSEKKTGSNINRMEKFFKTNQLYIFKNYKIKRYQSGHLKKDILDITSNGWDIDLLETLQEHVRKNRLPFLRPGIRFIIKSDKGKWMAWTSSYRRDLKPSKKYAIALNLQTNVSNLKDKKTAILIVINHELIHIRDSLYFLAGKNFGYNEFCQTARRNLVEKGFNNSKAKFIRFLNELDKTLVQGKSSLSLDQYLAEVRVWEKTPLDEALVLFQLRLHLKSRLEKYKQKRGKPGGLALDLLRAEKLKKNNICEIIRSAVAVLPSKEKELFQKLYELFTLQYEVSKLFIDYSVINTKFPPENK